MKNFNYKLQIANYKSLTLLLSYFLTVLLLNGCQKYPESQCPCGKIEISKKESIAMCIIPDIVTENSVNKLRIENYTKKSLSYGYGYSIEYFSENNWVLVEDDLLLPLVLLYIPAGEAIEDIASMFLYVEKYNEGKKGNYRITKKFGKDYYLHAEFEVK